MKTLETPIEIIKAAARMDDNVRACEAVGAALGVCRDRVYRASCVQKRLPAKWFDALEAMTGQTLPRGCFGFDQVSPCRPIG